MTIELTSVVDVSSSYCNEAVKFIAQPIQNKLNIYVWPQTGQIFRYAFIYPMMYDYTIYFISRFVCYYIFFDSG